MENIEGGKLAAWLLFCFFAPLFLIWTRRKENDRILDWITPILMFALTAWMGVHIPEEKIQQITVEPIELRTVLAINATSGNSRVKSGIKLKNLELGRTAYAQTSAIEYCAKRDKSIRKTLNLESQISSNRTSAFNVEVQRIGRGMTGELWLVSGIEAYKQVTRWCRPGEEVEIVNPLLI